MMTDLSLAEATRDVNELRAVEAGLRRIAEGDYGFCLDCGNDIGYERLKAYPTAMRCVTCQSQHEKVYATQGTPSL
jgi:RNA polymerase-binding transcription factor DksA